MKRIAKFHKVSLEQFKKDWIDTFGLDEEANIEEIYENIKLPRRATAGSAGYDFFAPVRLILEPGDSHRNSRGDGSGVGAEVLSEKRTGIQIPSAAE